MKLKCQCCGFEQEFDSRDIAFQAGWDVPLISLATRPVISALPCASSWGCPTTRLKTTGRSMAGRRIQSRYVRTGFGVGAFQRPAVFRQLKEGKISIWEALVAWRRRGYFRLLIVEHLLSQEINLVGNVQSVCPVLDLMRPEEIEFFQQLGRSIAQVLATCGTTTAGKHV